jgi:hypothetical protein
LSISRERAPNLNHNEKNIYPCINNREKVEKFIHAWEPEGLHSIATRLLPCPAKYEKHKLGHPKYLQIDGWFIHSNYD